MRVSYENQANDGRLGALARGACAQGSESGRVGRGLRFLEPRKFEAGPGRLSPV